MTLLYGVFGIPRNIDEFIEQAKRNGVASVILYRQKFLMNSMSESYGGKICIDKLVLDNGLNGFARRWLTLVDNTIEERNPFYNASAREDYLIGVKKEALGKLT